MDDIQKAALKRLEKGLNAAGYSVDQTKPAGNLAKIWIYGAGFKGGKVNQRATFHVAAETYKEMFERKGVFASELSEYDFESLQMFYAAYEDKSQKVSDEIAHATSFLLMRLILSQAVWNLVHEYDTSTGLHLVVVDHDRDDGYTRFGVFAIADHAQILTPVEIEDAVLNYVNM